MVSLRRRKTKSNLTDDATAAGTASVDDSKAITDSQAANPSAITSSSNNKGGRKKFNLEEAYANHRRRQQRKKPRGGSAATTKAKQDELMKTIPISSVPSDISIQNYLNDNDNNICYKFFK